MYLLLFAEAIQLFPDGTLFIHIGLILVMIYVLNRTLYRPINRVLEARERNKGGHSSEAEAILADVAAKDSRYTSEMLEARSGGYQHIEEEQNKAAAERDKQLVEARDEISSKFESEKAEMNGQADEARAAIATDADKIAESIAASILKG
jgi:F-type H+-transporting ATPase subunit b